MFQPSKYVNSSLEAHDLLNVSLIVQQGILRCVANNSLGDRSDEIKLYITGKSQSIWFSNFDTLKSENQYMCNIQKLSYYLTENTLNNHLKDKSVELVGK
jgi:hypothetical protein